MEAGQVFAGRINMEVQDVCSDQQCLDFR